MTNVNKELFIQDLKSKYTLLQEVRLLINTVLQLIDDVAAVESGDVENITELQQAVNSINTTLKVYTDNITYDESNNRMEFGGSVYVDGNIYTDVDISNDAVDIKTSNLNSITLQDFMSLLNENKFSQIRLAQSGPGSAAGYYIVTIHSGAVYGIMINLGDGDIYKVDIPSTVSTTDKNKAMYTLFAESNNFFTKIM